MRLSEAEYQALLKRGNVQEVQRHYGASRPHEPILTHGDVRHVSPAKSATRRQKKGMLAAKVAAAAWRAQLAAMPPLSMSCRQCQAVTMHQCSATGWRCWGCGTERLEEEQCLSIRHHQAQQYVL